MTVYDLTVDELNELKQRYYWDDCEESQLYYSSWWDVPSYVICNWYEGFNFVKDDFFCNL